MNAMLRIICITIALLVAAREAKAFDWPSMFMASIHGTHKSVDLSQFWLFECEDSVDRDSGSDDDQTDSEDDNDLITFSNDAFRSSACCSIAQHNLQCYGRGQFFIRYRNLRL